MVSEVYTYLQQKTELLFTEIVKVEGQERIIVDLKKFNTLSLALKRRIIRKSIEVIKGNLYSINFAHNNEILKLSEYQSGEKEIYLPENLRAKKSYNQLIIYRKRISKNWVDEISMPWEYNILISGKTKIKALDIEFETRILDSAEIKSSLYFNGKKPKGEFIEFIDYDKVKFPLKLRNRRIGDRFYPLKMIGEKKVKDYFIDNKIPKSHRDLVPILVDSENKIIWIVGMRMDNRVKITSASKKLLYLKMNIKTKSILASLLYDI
jgi:tRNA(Ile)-lysidine synthase